MGFHVVHDNPMTVWCPIVDLDTIFVGQIVANQVNEGIVPIGAATGAADTSGKQVPYGVVVGTNLRTPAYDATNLTDKITDLSPNGNTTEYAMIEGVWAKGDKVAMAEVALIDATTVLEGRLFTDSIGTAPTLLTVTTGGTVSSTTNATDEAGIASKSTLYFRTGANAGAYRITDDTNTTALTWDKATTNTVAVDDTCVRVNIRAQGQSRCNFDSEALFVDTGATITSNYYVIDVIKLDLSVAGNEKVQFRFGADHFALLRT